MSVLTLEKIARSRFKPLPLALAISVALAPAAWAEESATTLDPVTVSAERGSDTNTVVKASRIEAEQANSLHDLFKQMPEVAVGGGISAAQKVYVRGISERMLTITVDGASQPESAYHHSGQIMVEPDLLKRVEIEAGTGSATAGPGALAGAIRFTTKNPSDLLKAGEHLGLRLSGGYQSVNDGKKVGLTAYGRLDNGISAMFSQHLLKTGDYTDGNGNTVANSASDSSNSFMKFGFDRDGHASQVAYEHIEDEGLRFKRTNLGAAAFNPVQRQQTQRDSLTFNYQFASDNPLFQPYFTAFTNKNQILLGKDEPTHENVGSKSYGLNLKNISRLGNQRLTYGLDYRHDSAFSDVAGINDETASVMGLFVQDDYTLADQWMLGAGLRYDRYTYTDKVDAEFNSQGFSPSLSVTYAPLDSLSIQASHSRALRGVTVTEPYLLQYQDNAASIEAEKARNTELAATWKQNGWHASGNVFRQTIDNYIGYDDFHQNLGTVDVDGYSASLGYSNATTSLSFGLSHSKPELEGEALSDGTALLLGNTAGRTWVAQLDHALPSYHLTLGWTGRLVESYDYTPVNSADPGTKAGYAVHDIYAQWLPTGKDNLKLLLSVKNLFDRFYYDQSSFGYHPRWGGVAGLPEAGRDIRLTAQMTF